MKMYIAILAMALILFSTTACEREHLIPNEEELITTLTYSLVSSADTVHFTFRDLDGDGGDPPVITADTLQAGTIYSGTIQLLNESITPPEDITQEVEEEADEHMFFFTGQDEGSYRVEYDDVDNQGRPVGIKTTFFALQPGIRTLTITLRHQPDKNQPIPLPETAGGETDIEVTFPIVIQ